MREYVLVSELDEISEDQRLIVLVTIPYGEDETYCLNYAGEVLAALFVEREP